MPTPDRTSLAAIVAAGRDIIETQGLAGLTMQAIAGRVGVRAPSLYKRVKGRDALIALIADATATDLGERLDRAVAESADPRSRLSSLAHAFRTFAHTYPRGYFLIFAPGSEAVRAGSHSLTLSTESLFRVATELAGPQNALAAARTVTAWASGFISMELAGNFRFDGDVDDAFEFGIAQLAAALGHRRMNEGVSHGT